MRRAAFVISVDSGPAHLAAALGSTDGGHPRLERPAQGRPLPAGRLGVEKRRSAASARPCRRWTQSSFAPPPTLASRRRSGRHLPRWLLHLQILAHERRHVEVLAVDDGRLALVETSAHGVLGDAGFHCRRAPAGGDRDGRGGGSAAVDVRGERARARGPGSTARDQRRKAVPAAVLARRSRMASGQPARAPSELISVTPSRPSSFGSTAAPKRSWVCSPMCSAIPP